MEHSPELIRFYWRLKNFCFSNLYSNTRLSSPAFEVRTHIASKWKLYMFPNGWGLDNYVGIYLRRKEDCGPENLTVLFRICLVDQNGELCPDGPREERVFGRGVEHGYNKFIKRSDLKSDSRFITDDTLTVYCEFKIIDGNSEDTIPANQVRANHEDYKDTERICRAMKLMYDQSLHSDITLNGTGRKFRVHKCILERRLPLLYRELEISPEKVYKNDRVTQEILLYAYTGKLDFRALEWWNVRSVLGEYGLNALEDERIQLTQNLIAVNTYFVVNKRAFSWRISRQRLNENDVLNFDPIVDEQNEIRFMAFLTRSGGNLWNFSIDICSGDESFVRWKISLGGDPHCFEEGENSIKNGHYLIEGSSILSLQDTTLLINEQFAQFVDDSFTLKFDFSYPTCDTNWYSSTECHSESANCQPFEDTHRLLKSLEALYSGEMGDIVVSVRNTNRSFNVHKCIISSRSEFFRKTLEQDMVEKKRNEIPLKCPYDNLTDDLFADIVDKLFLYIYCGKMENLDEEFRKHLQAYLDFCLVGE